jgi:hypothetical protein
MDAEDKLIVAVAIILAVAGADFFIIGHTFRTHGISMVADNGSYIETKGDGNLAQDPWLVPKTEVYGVVLFWMNFEAFLFFFNVANSLAFAFVVAEVVKYNKEP